MRFDTVWLDARMATLAPGRPGLGIVERGAVAAKDGRIVFAGPAAELPTGWDAIARVGLDGRWITPGLIDCHTHLVYAGDRAHEFELRLTGASYEEIARAGGGIVSTVKATRAASEDELVAATLAAPRCIFSPRASPRSRSSRATASIATPRRACCAPRGDLAREREVDVVTSFLGAHALPPEANGDKERYIDQVCAHDPRARARTARRRGRCLLRRHRVLARADRARVRRRQGRRAAGQAACRPALQSAWRERSPPSTVRCRPIISNIPTRTASPRWRAPARSRCCCRARSTCCERSRRRRSTPSAGTGCRSRSRPTSNPGTSPITSLLTHHEHGGDACSG